MQIDQQMKRLLIKLYTKTQHCLNTIYYWEYYIYTNVCVYVCTHTEEEITKINVNEFNKTRFPQWCS